MIIDIIINGLLSIFGLGLFVSLMWILTFLLLLISRGAGITSLIGVFALSVYLFATTQTDYGYLLSNNWLITVMILFGLLIGYLFYMVLLKD